MCRQGQDIREAHCEDKEHSDIKRYSRRCRKTVSSTDNMFDDQLVHLDHVIRRSMRTKTKNGGTIGPTQNDAKKNGNKKNPEEMTKEVQC